MVLRQAGWKSVQAMQNVLLRGVGWGNCNEKKTSELLLDQKKNHTNITRKENHKGLRKMNVYLEHSGCKKKKFMLSLK